jgi:hypothetical protein
LAQRAASCAHAFGKNSRKSTSVVWGPAAQRGKHPHLAVRQLAQPAAVLPLHAD